MNKKLSKFTAMILTVSLLLTSMPAFGLSIFADDGEETKYDNAWDYTIFGNSIEFPVALMSGSSISIYGDAHANESFQSFSRTLDAGTVEAGDEINTNNAFTTTESMVENAENIALPQIYYSIMSLEGNKARSEIAENTPAEDLLRTSIISDDDIVIDLTGNYPQDMQRYTKKAGVFSADFLTKVYENPNKWANVLPAFGKDANITTDINGNVSLIDLCDNSYFIATNEQTIGAGYTDLGKLPDEPFMSNLNTGYVSGYIDTVKSNISDTSDYYTLTTDGISPSEAQGKAKLHIPNNKNVALQGDYDDLEELYLDSYNEIQLLGNFPKLKHIYANSGSPNLNLAGNFPSLEGVYKTHGTMLLGTANMGFNASGAVIINEYGQITLYTAKDTNISGCQILNKNNDIAIRGGGVNGEASAFIADGAVIASNGGITMVDMNDDNTSYFSEIPAIVSQAPLSIINCNFKLLQGAFLTRNGSMKFANSNVDVFSGFLFAQNGIDEWDFNGTSVYCETYNYLVQPNINQSYVNLYGSQLGHIGKIEYAHLPQKLMLIPGMDDMLDDSMKIKNTENQYVEYYEYGLRDDEENIIYIMSEGDITIDADLFNTPKGRRMIIASHNGDITINPSCYNSLENRYYSTSNFDGILYAPKGEIELWQKRMRLFPKV